MRFFDRLCGVRYSHTRTVEIICLANSRKRGGRCLAGLRTDGSGWLRPIGSGPESALRKHDTRISGREAQILEAIGVDLSHPAPSPRQPENWVVTYKWYNPWYKPCRAVVREAVSEIADMLHKHVTNGPDLFGCCRDRIDAATFLDAPAESSLTLVCPQNVYWLIRTSRSGKRQTRTVFELAGASYNLSITDPVWEQRLALLPLGMHSCRDEHIESMDNMMYTISLGEPFAGNCYKLVAGVFSCPPCGTRIQHSKEDH